MKAILALENGQWFEGKSVGAPGETSGEVVFNTSLTGLSGGADRPVVRRSDRHDDGAADRQLRGERRRCRVARTSGGRLRRPRGVANREQLARGRARSLTISAARRHRRDCRDRHPRADARAPIGRRDARRHRDRRVDSNPATSSIARGRRADGRGGLGPDRHVRAAVRLDTPSRRRRRPATRAVSAGRTGAAGRRAKRDPALPPTTSG